MATVEKPQESVPGKLNLHGPPHVVIDWEGTGGVVVVVVLEVGFPLWEMVTDPLAVGPVLAAAVSFTDHFRDLELGLGPILSSTTATPLWQDSFLFNEPLKVQVEAFFTVATSTAMPPVYRT
jgi:hypothetical protein